MPAVRSLYGDMLPALEIHWITEADHLHAQHAWLSSDRREVRLVDCSSFYIMRQRMITTAFAFHPHFGEQGFEVVPAG
jgi:predicted nucleic acid-binding protein